MRLKARDINRAIDSTIDTIGIPTNGEIDINLDGGTQDPEDPDYLAYKAMRDQYRIGGDVAHVQAELMDGLAYVLGRRDLAGLHPLATQITSHLSIDHQVRPNLEGVRAVGEQVLGDIEDKLKESRELQDLLENDYDAFLDSLEKYQLVSDQQTVKSYPVALFHGNQETIDLLHAQPNLLESYVDMHKPLVE
ncbi:MAG: hypothetical protein H6765_04060 [Candidatus Peribacteria bacterium]|nr:MAG: hypothetical protein H6765_04060 [Candidatus Peribacteria bacterium]